MSGSPRTASANTVPSAPARPPSLFPHRPNPATLPSVPTVVNRFRPILIVVACLSLGHAFAQQKPEAQELPYVPGKRWAIVVGASGYEHFGQLKYADDDAKAVAQTLVENYRFEPDTVRLLTDTPDSKLKPTAGDILGEIEDALANKAMSKSDLFIFFFAGHGVGTSKGDYLLPTDARPSTVERVGLPVSEVVERFTKAGMKNVLIICDACRAGKANPFGAELEKLGREANIAVMLGCAPGARSYEDRDLKHGVFAYHLLRALKDPTLRDRVSGALWASSIATWTKTKVKAYTERDYGADAQVPHIWGNRADDVLLGAFVPTGQGSELVRSFSEKAKGLTPKYYASALAEFAQRLFDTDRYPETVEVLKTLEQLGEMEPASRYLLALSLGLMDRTNEANNEFKRLVEGDDGYFKNLALVTNGARTSTPNKKLAAAAQLWEEDRSWSTGYLVWSVFKVFGTEAAQIKHLKDMLSGLTLTKRQSEYLKGELANVERRWSDALTAFRAAEKGPPGAPDNNLLYLLEVPLLTQLGRPNELDDLIDRLAKTSPKSYWKLLKADRLKLKGKNDESIEWVQKALDSNPAPEELLHALRTAGMRMGFIAEQISREADKHPYSWKALLAKTLPVAMKGGTPALLEALEEASKQAENMLAFRIAAMEVYDVFLEELFNDGKLEPMQYMVFIDASCSQILDYQDEFGQDLDAWWDLVYFGSRSERILQISRLMERRLGAAVQDGSINPALAVSLMIGFANVGNDARVEALYRIAKANGDRYLDATRLYAVYLAYKGRFADAEKTYVVVTDDDPSTKSAYLAFAAWLDAALGRKQKALAILDKLPDDLAPYGSAVAGLAYAALGDKAKAMPLLARSRQQRSWGYQFLHARALEVLSAYLREDKDQPTLDQVTFENSISQYGNPAFAWCYFGSSPSVAAFGGDYKFDIKGTTDDYEVFSGALNLKVTPTGAVEGIFESEGHLYKVEGRVDGLGTLTGTVTGEGKRFDVFAKIAPPSLYPSFASFTEQGQAFLLLDSTDRRNLWVGVPPKG
jgi:hypothetical protein